MRVNPGWTDRIVEGYRIIGFEAFMTKYEEAIPAWVKDFASRGIKEHEFGTAVVVNPGDFWQQDHEGVTICQISMDDPTGVRSIIIGEYNSLVEAKVLRRCPLDGQNRTKSI